MLIEQAVAIETAELAAIEVELADIEAVLPTREAGAARQSLPGQGGQPVSRVAQGSHQLAASCFIWLDATIISFLRSLRTFRHGEPELISAPRRCEPSQARCRKVHNGSQARAGDQSTAGQKTIQAGTYTVAELKRVLGCRSLPCAGRGDWGRVQGSSR